ncbi:hypothetical protein JKP88DRAFT_166201 [Tribonema minus]|uniref:Fungal lipase-type domain-containing protein n=1 Tax=Tribonema minus TaxID=303371 RepID=A0A835YWF8_9STRA|nr:hypothetical protein JKP88DRAFT_166201 [Tribonema minus]
MACLAAYDIASNFALPDELSLYTFGAPRVGNAAFARRLDARVRQHFRVVNDGDLIAGLPQFLGTYRHAGCKVVTDSEKFGTFIVEPTIVENTFGIKASTLITVHPLREYRECLEACLGDEDLQEYMAKGYAMAHAVDSCQPLTPPRVLPDWLKERRKRSLQEP